MFTPVTPKDDLIELARRGADHASRLAAALRLVRARASRSSSVLQEVLASATVEGRATKAEIKAAVISFSAWPFRGGLHLFYPWEFLEQLSASELALELSASIRRNVAEALKAKRGKH